MRSVSERISSSDVAHVARLARLTLTPEELELYSGQLAAVLDLAAEVASLDTASVPPTAHPVPLQNVLREDRAGECLEREEVLDQAPLAEDGTYFRVPPILGEAP
ncbi:MAG: Asp-tRNA(Asn)/Glu-tRNA(Gln) amidotransferase subunit GatC [Acidimicrobiales bacterium]|nr:Asp-tRNA(Asn)/Glu-tRNA(Gln) amidotransferase subunit GatC [Acidimicrobiales bacterium]